VHGNIETERLAIAEGSLFEGRILMSSLEGEPVRFEEKREPPHKRERKAST
jgi:cytoskeletal protein CcmA (bactofilin family)